MNDANTVRRWVRATNDNPYITVADTTDGFTTLLLEPMEVDGPQFGIYITVEHIVDYENKEFVEPAEGEEITNLAELQFDTVENNVYAVLHSGVEDLLVNEHTHQEE